MKIGIYTIHSHYNYGAMFQAYGTQKALEKLGFDAELVNVYTKEEEFKNEHNFFSFKLKFFLIYFYTKINPKIPRKFKRFRDFHSNMNLSKRYFGIEEIYKNPPQYDIHLAGSDQIWNIQRGFSDKPYYFLDFLNDDDIKISYASSFGASNINPIYNEKLSNFLSTFKAIAVREDEGVEIIKKATGLDAVQVMDPTFLLDDKEWGALDTVTPIVQGDYIFCYGFDGSEKSKQMVESIRQRLNLPLVAVAVGLFFPFKIDKFIKDAGPLEFINLIRNAKFVISGSYHGIAFAIHFRKSFFGTIHPTRNARMKTMLNKLNLSNRQLEYPEKILYMSDDQVNIDYKLVENNIKKVVNSSIIWLKQNINI